MALQQMKQIENNETTLLNNNVLSRINYVFKFTQQLVLVVDENTDNYTSVGYQYLGQQSTECNACLVSVSAKFTDIQLRCRIIEQLSPNAIFDPEKPLIESLVKLLANTNQHHCIVIEHGQFLTAVMINELADAVNHCREDAQLNVNVLLLGNQYAVKLAGQIDETKTELVCISATTGQLVIANTAIKTAKKPISKNRPAILLWSVGLLGIVVITSFIVLLLQAQGSTVAKFPLPSSTSKITADKSIKSEDINTVAATNIADVSDVFLALTVAQVTGSEDELGVAFPKASEQLTIETEILNDAGTSSTLSMQLDTQATTFAEQQSNIQPLLEVESTDNVEKSMDSDTINLKPSTAELDSTTQFNDAYAPYLQSDKGYVLQFANLSTESAALEFIRSMETTIQLIYYPKLIGDKVSYAVTSDVFDSKNLALTSLESLPKQQKELGVWVKKIDLVKQELTQYLSSQP